MTFARRVDDRVPGVGEQVDEHLLELDRAAHDHRPLGTQPQLDRDLPQSQLLPDQGQGPLDHRVDGHQLAVTGAARPKVRRCEMISVALRTCCIALLSSTSRVSWSVLPSWTRSIALPTNRPMLLSGLFSSWAMPVVSSPRVASLAAWISCSCLSRSSRSRRWISNVVSRRSPMMWIIAFRPFSNCTLAGTSPSGCAGAPGASCPGVRRGRRDGADPVHSPPGCAASPCAGRRAGD